jgi:HlyD family secretion protein
MKLKKKGIVIYAVIILALVLIVLLLTILKKKDVATIYNTQKVSRGDISVSISSTGTVQALKTVDVGTQVSGVISRIYVDFNSVVKKGQLMAELDKTPLIANMEDAQASLDDANAEVTYQKSKYDRIKALFDRNLAAQSDFELAFYNYTKAQAGLKIAKAKYDKAKVNLAYATIYSPIDGVVLNRAVDEGQTVAASFNTPTLFSIANDLTQMQVEADIDEADIGQIKLGQEVGFTVDAFPDDQFTGEVSQIRLQPVTTSNVTTYTVIIRADNPDKKLMPGMTASLVVVIKEANDVLMIPSRALLFKPDFAESSMSDKNSGSGHRVAREGTGPAPDMRMDRGDLQDMEQVWIKRDGNVFPRPVKTGINDGLNAEVLDGLTENEDVVISSSTAISKGTSSQAQGASPFMPRPPGRR